MRCSLKHRGKRLQNKYQAGAIRFRSTSNIWAQRMETGMARRISLSRTMPAPVDMGVGLKTAWHDFQTSEMRDEATHLHASMEQYVRLKNKMLRMREMHKIAAAHYTKYYYFFMIPSIIVSVMTSGSAALFDALKLPDASYKVWVCCAGALNTVLTSVVAFLKLQSTMDGHLSAIDLYDALFTEFEFEQELTLLDTQDCDKKRKALAGKISDARDKIQRAQATCPQVPLWVTTKMIPLAEKNKAESTWEKQAYFDLKEVSNSLIQSGLDRLKMEDNKRAKSNDAKNIEEYGRIVSDFAEWQSLELSGEPSKAIEAKQLKKSLNSSIQTLLSQCRRPSKNGEEAPLSDEEYDLTQDMYAQLNELKHDVLEKQINEFQKLMQRIVEADDAYFQKEALVQAGEKQKANAINVMDDSEYDEMRASAQQKGSALMQRLRVLYWSPLSRKVDDKKYDKLRTSLDQLNQSNQRNADNCDALDAKVAAMPPPMISSLTPPPPAPVQDIFGNGHRVQFSAVCMGRDALGVPQDTKIGRNAGHGVTDLLEEIESQIR